MQVRPYQVSSMRPIVGRVTHPGLPVAARDTTKEPEAPAQSAPPVRGREDGTEGCSDENTRLALIQPEATERLRNAHLHWDTNVLPGLVRTAWHTPPR